MEIPYEPHSAQHPYLQKAEVEGWKFSKRDIGGNKPYRIELRGQNGTRKHTVGLCTSIIGAEAGMVINLEEDSAKEA